MSVSGPTRRCYRDGDFLQTIAIGSSGMRHCRQEIDHGLGSFAPHLSRLCCSDCGERLEPNG
jgi:hypothetical protein